jgi:predicted secreted protein
MQFITSIRHAAAVTAIAATACAWTVQASAQDVAAPGTAPAAASAQAQMTLQANASADITQDTVQMTLALDVDAPTQAAAGQQLNARLADLMKRAKGTANVDAHSGSYSVWPMNDNKGKVTSWHGRADIVLESRDFEAASRLAGELGDKSAISNIQFTLSRQARAAAEQRLLTQVADAFRDRAKAAATAFGFSGYRIVKLDLGGSGAPPMPRPRVMAMASMAKSDARAPDVPLAPSDETVSVGVTGTIALQ